MQSMWHRSTKIWNSLENESKVTIESFSNILEGNTSPKAKQIVFDFLQYMIDHNKAVMIDSGSVIKKYNFIRKRKRIDYGSISMNIIGLLNGLSLKSTFTNKDFLKKYTEVFQSICSYETVNRMLTNAANIGCLEKSNGKPVVYCKINYIPKDKYHLITAKKRKNIKKKKSVSSSIVKLLEAKGLVLTDRISTAIINEIATEINRRPTTVRNAIYTARKKINYKRKSVTPGVKINNGFDENRDNKNKVIVEKFFIETVKKYLNEKVRCLAITGPDYYRHVNSLFSTFAEKVFVVEIENGVFKTIFDKAQNCPNYNSNKVQLINADINDVTIRNCRYVDLDLMSSISGITSAVYEQVELQKYSVNFNDLKFITFTACDRNDGGPKNRLIALQKLLDYSFQAHLQGFQGKYEDYFGDPVIFNKKGNKDNKNFKHCYKRIPIFSEYGCIVDISIFTYQDTSPMISVLVVYK